MERRLLSALASRVSERFSSVCSVLRRQITSFHTNIQLPGCSVSPQHAVCSCNGDSCAPVPCRMSGCDKIRVTLMPWIAFARTSVGCHWKLLLLCLSERLTVKQQMLRLGSKVNFT